MRANLRAYAGSLSFLLGKALLVLGLGLFVFALYCTCIRANDIYTGRIPFKQTLTYPGGSMM